jgi:hypothetical protein
MIELGESEGLAAETPAGRFIGQHAGREDLDGDLSLEAFIVSEIDDAHASGTDLPADAIVAYGFADHGKREEGEWYSAK